MASDVLNDNDKEVISSATDGYFEVSDRGHAAVMSRFPDRKKAVDFSKYESTTRNFDSSIAAYSLRNARKALSTVREAVQSAQAFDETSAIEVSAGVKAFSVPMHKEGFFGLAMMHGEDRFVIVQGPLVMEKDGDSSEEVFVSRWKPLATDADVAKVLPQGDKLSQVPPSEIVRAAASLNAVSMKDDDFHLSSIVEIIQTEGQAPYDNRLGHLKTMLMNIEERTLTSLVGNMSDDTGEWKAFAGMLRPLVLASAPKLADWRAERSMENSMLADAAIKLDGGFSGPACEAASEMLRERIWTRYMNLLGESAAKLADNVAAQGFVWGKKLLVYADYDRSTFAIPGAEPGVMGRWHKNSDLICDMRSHIAVTRCDEAGKLLRLESYPCYEPAGDILGYDRNRKEETIEQAVRRVSAYALIYADEQADPPRLTRRMLAERIAKGEPLPKPAGGFDFETGTVLPGTTRDELLVMRNTLYGFGEDRMAMDRIAAGELPGLMRKDITTCYNLFL